MHAHTILCHQAAASANQLIKQVSPLKAMRRIDEFGFDLRAL